MAKNTGRQNQSTIPAPVMAQEYEAEPAATPFTAATIPEKPSAATVQKWETFLEAKVAQPELQENLKQSSIVAAIEAKTNNKNTFKMSKVVTPQ